MISNQVFVLCIRALCLLGSEVVRARGLDQITVEELVTEITPKGRGKIPHSLVFRIRIYFPIWNLQISTAVSLVSFRHFFFDTVLWFKVLYVV